MTKLVVRRDQLACGLLRNANSRHRPLPLKDSGRCRSGTKSQRSCPARSSSELWRTGASTQIALSPRIRDRSHCPRSRTSRPTRIKQTFSAFPHWVKGPEVAEKHTREDADERNTPAWHLNLDSPSTHKLSQVLTTVQICLGTLGRPHACMLVAGWPQACASSTTTLLPRSPLTAYETDGVMAIRCASTPTTLKSRAPAKLSGVVGSSTGSSAELT